jgi:hypothetical protein
MVFNATFNNISVIVVVGFIGGGNWSTRKKPPTCHKSPTNFVNRIVAENKTLLVIPINMTALSVTQIFHNR